MEIVYSLWSYISIYKHTCIPPTIVLFFLFPQDRPSPMFLHLHVYLAISQFRYEPLVPAPDLHCSRTILATLSRQLIAPFPFRTSINDQQSVYQSPCS